jgi:hypothetical protein
MAKIVRKYDCGIIADNFDPKNMAEKLNALTKEKLQYYKDQSHKAAYELSWDTESLSFKKIIEMFLNT